MTKKDLFKDPELDSLSIRQSDFDDLLELQSSILGLAANNDNCSDLMKRLCFMAEKLTPDSVASIMLYEEEEDKLYVHTAPSLPQKAVDALNGLQVGTGSCGNAVYHKKAMYVSNTLEDNRWCETRNFAEAFNVSACWSVPFYDETNKIIGTFALTSFEIREATNFQRKLLNTCAFIAGILLQKEKYLQQNAQLEKETLRFEKLKSIGVLAGGIAHDFNNLLGIVIGNLEMIERVADKKSKVSSYVSSATKASKRAAELTQQLLTFSKGGNPVKKLSDLREVVYESAKFVLHGSSVALTFDCQCAGDNVLIADIDNGQISQVVQNMVINARQAMPDGGTIRIECDTEELSAHEVSGVKAGRYHKIEIHDDGPGIATDIVDKIFDPYFTTKSEGSGLGLALSFAIINKHDGYLYASTEDDGGACFTIYLPASDSILDVVPDSVITINNAASKGCVLVMDDQEMLYEVAEAMLEELGYQAIHAEDGSTALRLYEEAMAANEPIDIIIMDLTIPGGMGGEEAVKEILSVDAKAKVIVSSGYSNDSVVANYENHGFKGALGKPYDIDTLDNLLNQILAQ